MLLTEPGSNVHYSSACIGGGHHVEVASFPYLRRFLTVQEHAHEEPNTSLVWSERYALDDTSTGFWLHAGVIKKSRPCQG